MPHSHRLNAPEERAFRRKIALSRWALLFERLWPRLWVPIGVAGLFVLTSLLGVWTILPIEAHWGLLGAFAIAGLVALAIVLRVRWPSRIDAIRRLEARSGLPHHPASSYEDTVSSAPEDGQTAAIWRAHQARLKSRLGKLEVGAPVPRTDRADPIGLRAVLMLMVVTALALVGDSASDRLQAAFRFSTFADIAGARLDAWVTPPPYTSRPPVLLSDGSQREAKADAPGALPRVFEVPEQSTIFVRLGGKAPVALTLEYLDTQGQPMAQEQPAPAKGRTGADGKAKSGHDPAPVVRQVKGVLKPGTAVVRVLAGKSELATWSFKIIADKAPEISFTKEPERTRRGAMKLHYAMKDDYGIASAQARLERLPLDPGDPKTSWARTDELKGARPPLERPPRIVLRIPPRGAKTPNTWSFHELGAHPWAGMRVRMTLVANDHAGHVGKSKAKEFVLPERLFFNPLARAVIEQRRKLVFDPRYAKQVGKAIDALTIAPDLYLPDKAVYLGLRSARHRLRQDQSRRAISSVVGQLWHLALRIENGGGLSEAERRLKEIQEKLSKAIERGASDKEIKELMKQLRQALAQFLQELAKQAQRMPPQQRQPEPNQRLTQRDLQRMLDNLERMARQGSKQSAQEMLSQLRELLDRLQSGRMARRQGQGQRNQQMMRMMDKFGEIIGKQQRLMDDTYGAQRQGRQGQRGQQQGRQGQRGQQGGQGQRGQGQRPGQQNGSQQGQLESRQGQLESDLGGLQRDLRRFGLRPPGQLDGARRSMENARRALERRDYSEATRQQSRALEQLRQGTRSMAQQLRRRMPGQFRRADDAPLDPLGRPQRTEGPDLGTSVKVPDEIDAARVREILRELRKRLGERYRPELEREYIERLLERF